MNTIPDIAKRRINQAKDMAEDCRKTARYRARRGTDVTYLHNRADDIATAVLAAQEKYDTEDFQGALDILNNANT